MDARFLQYTDYIIQNIEGGYYHPNMKAANPSKFAAMGISGETLFGMDRLHGGSLMTSDAGKKFWALVDAQNASSKWAYNYIPTGDLGAQLRSLACEMMYSQYTKLSATYLKDVQSLVSASKELEVHFFYACWNGAGWFQHFAQELTAEVQRQRALISKGKQTAINYNLLIAQALYSRIYNYKGNRLIANGGNKISAIWKKYFGKSVTLTPEIINTLHPKKDSRVLPWVATGIIAIAAIWATNYKYHWISKIGG